MPDPTQERPSTRKTSQLVQIAAAAANTLIYTLSQGATNPITGVVGTRTAKIKKIMLMNNTGVNDTVIFGEVIAGVWTPRLPAVYVLTPFDEQLSEWEIPQYEFQTNIWARSAGAGVGTTMDVLIEVEEIG